MLESSIITGKAYTGNPSKSNSVQKRLYLKIFPGEFFYKPPRPKKAKVYTGELLVRYSNREWPEKKNGPLVGDPGLLVGIADLLRELKLEYASEIEYAKIQHDIKEVLTLSVGPNLAKEIVDRGWAILNEITEVKVPKPIVQVESKKDPSSEVVTIGEAVMMPVEQPEQSPQVVVETPSESKDSPILTQTDAIEQLYGKKKPSSRTKRSSAK